MDTIVIAASLGRLKAYRVEETPTRGRKLSLIEDMEFVDAHGGLAEHMSDRSGRFPKAFGGKNQKSGHLSAYEAGTMELELHRRLIRTVGEQMVTILMRERPEVWYFAAAPEIHDQLLEGMPHDLRARMLRTERADLVNLPPQELLPRFTPWSQ